jgi:RNA polymerase sigma-70 factor (ECF subfamily)
MGSIAAAVIPAFGLTSSGPIRQSNRMEGTERALSGSTEDVFRALVEEHSRAVFRLAYRVTGNEQDAEDVVQETFLKAHKHFGRFDSRASFATWIHRIATNCSIDLLRRRSRRMGWGGAGGGFEAEDLPSHRPGPEARARGLEVEASVARALDSLSPNERAAFVLRHIEGLSTEEIAAALSLRTNAAKQTVFRAVHKLRRLLAPLLEAEP